MIAESGKHRRCIFPHRVLFLGGLLIDLNIFSMVGNHSVCEGPIKCWARHPSHLFESGFLLFVRTTWRIHTERLCQLDGLLVRLPMIVLQCFPKRFDATALPVLLSELA